MTAKKPLRFYCDESGQTGTNWLDPDQPVVVHGGWLFPEGTERSISEGVADIRRRYRLNGNELKWAQFTRPGRTGAFKEIFELCLAHGLLPMFMVMDKRFATAAKVVETFFDPAYNPFFDPGFTGDFDTKKQIAEIILRSPSLVSRFAPLLRAGERPSVQVISGFATELGQHLIEQNYARFGRTLLIPSKLAIDDIRDEFAAEPMIRSTTWTVMWAMASLVIDFVNDRELEVEIFQDQIVRFDDLIAQIAGQLGVARVELVNSTMHLGIQLADLLCGFIRMIFVKVTTGADLSPEERNATADLFMLKHQFESWNGNLPEQTWMTFISLAMSELKHR